MALRTVKPILKQQNTLYDRVIRWCLLGAVFFVPIFFLPFTTDTLELNKALLFYLFVLIAGVTWLFKLVMQRGASMARTPIDLLLALYVLLNIVVAAFSIFHYRSIVGTTGYISNALVSTLFFTFFFLLCVQTVKKHQMNGFVAATLLSGALLVLFNYLQVFSVFVFPWSFAKQVSFNAASNSLAIFTVYLAVIGMAALFVTLRIKQPIVRVLTALLAVLALFLLTVYDQPVAWYALIIGLVLMLVFLNAASRALKPAWLLLPAIGIGYALIALFINTQSLLQANIPGDVSLPFSVSKTIAWQETTHTPLLGTGQETFDAAFAKYRPASYNTSTLWNVRFIKSSNEWLQLLSTVGPLTTLIWAVLVVLFFVHQFRTLLRTKFDDPLWWHRAGLVTVGAMLLVGSFFMPFNFLAAFLFWLVLAVGSILARSQEPEGMAGTREQSQQRAFSASLGFAAIVVLGIVFLYFAGRFWMADRAVARANELISKTEKIENVQSLLVNAVDLNPYEQAPYFNLARNYLTQAQLEGQKKDGNVAQIRNFIASGVASAQAGAGKYPKFSGSSEALSAIYRDIDTLTGATSAETGTAFTKATELEPNNPQLFYNLGQYQLTVAQVKASAKTDTKDTALPTDAVDALKAAQAAFEKAYALKTNYTNAAINVALALRLQGKTADAIAYLEKLAATFNLNTDVLFNLAENYRLDGKKDDALAVYQRIVSIFPGHSDAHFRIAQIYEEKGLKDQAIAEYTIVKQYNPGNTDVTKKLDELQGKK